MFYNWSSDGDEKSEDLNKSLLKFCAKGISFVFFYFKSISYVLYSLNDEKVRI